MTTTLRLCLSLIATDDEREDRLGDLEESYAENLRSVGVSEARRRYRRDLWSCIASTARRRVAGAMETSALALLAAISIAALGFGYVSNAAGDPWWIKSGFDRNPGYLVTENRVDYPVCASWEGDKPDSAGFHLTAAQTQTVILPRTARVAKIYCSVHSSQTAFAECSQASCQPRRSALFSDSTYTRGRALTLMSPDQRRGNDIRYWVLWQD